MRITINNIGKEQDDYLCSYKKGKEIWCCEDNLLRTLTLLFPIDKIVHNKQYVTKNRKIYRPDFRIDSLKYIIEFQGYQHFTSAKNVYNDHIRKQSFIDEGWNYIEIPYFIQLTQSVVKLLFNINADVSNGFPHGFIHPKAILLGDFCTLGIKRAIDIFSYFPDEVKNDCFNSLKNRAMILNIPESILNPIG